MNHVNVNFCGIGIEATTYRKFLGRIDVWLKNKTGRSRHVAVINAYCAALAVKDKRLADIYRKADMVGPDGTPFVYWMRLFTRQQCDRFDASSILLNLMEHSKKSDYSFYFYGGHSDVLCAMIRNLEIAFPHIRIAGRQAPPFRPLTAEEDMQLCEEINRLNPDFLCVGLGTPKQDYWIDDHLEKIRGSVMIPCGAIFDFLGGRVKRAPVFIQKLGFEWLYRLFGKDFRRLWKRYIIYNALFLFHFVLQVLRIRVRPATRMPRPPGIVLKEP